MRIDKDKINRLSALGDDELWREVVTMAEGFGFKLPKDTPAHADMQKLRSAVSAEKINARDAVRLLKTYKKGG